MPRRSKMGLAVGLVAPARVAPGPWSDLALSPGPPGPRQNITRIGEAKMADDIVETNVPTTDVELDTEEAKDEAAGITGAAAMNVLARIAEHQAQTNGLLLQMQQQQQANSDAFARALAGTDISAQRAAQAAETVESAIEPVDQTSPDAGEKPEDIKELPTREVQAQKSKTFYFGKVALRHGKGR